MNTLELIAALKHGNWGGKGATIGGAELSPKECLALARELSRQYWPAGKVPLGSYLVRHDAAQLRIDRAWQDAKGVTIGGVNERTGHAWQERFAFSAVVQVTLYRPEAA